MDTESAISNYLAEQEAQGHLMFGVRITLELVRRFNLTKSEAKKRLKAWRHREA